MLREIKDNTSTFFCGIIEFLKMIIKQIRSIRLNRNFLVFLVFIAISTALWFMQTAMETLTATVDYRIKIVNAPKNIIYTSKISDSIKVQVSALGSSYFTYFASYLFNKEDKVIPVEYDDIDCTSSHMTISNSILKRNISKHLGGDFRVVSVSPAQIIAYYTTGKPKRLPIVFDGQVTADKSREITGIKLSPDSADVYLPYSLYDSVKTIYADCEPLKDIVDPTTIRAALKKIDKVLVSPDSVDIKINVDFQSEKKLTVKIYSVNCPENKIVRTFPRNVDLTFRAIASQLNNITANDFSIVVDYKKIKPGDKYCNVVLAIKPDCVSKVHFTPQKVQFVMENVNE